MVHFTEISKTLKQAESDFVKFYLHKNKSAGVRLRKYMQAIKLHAQAVRDDVQAENSQGHSVVK